MHFWYPSRIFLFGSEKAPEPKREGNHGIDLFLIFKSYAFLAPLSDPILAPKRFRSPNRKEIMESISYAFLAYQAPLSDPVFGSEIVPEPKR